MRVLHSLDAPFDSSDTPVLLRVIVSIHPSFIYTGSFLFQGYRDLLEPAPAVFGQQAEVHPGQVAGPS